MLRCLPPRSTAFYAINHPLAHVRGVCPRHRPASQSRINNERLTYLRANGNPPDSIRPELALAKEPYPFPDIWDPLARVFDAWGLDRCLWGTDWTRAFAVVSYEQGVEPFLKTNRLSDADRAILMGGSTAKAYGWSPKKT
jgi:L-fuconolactonase